MPNKEAYVTTWSIGWMREVVRVWKAWHQILQSWLHNLLVWGCDGALSRSIMACTSSSRIFNTYTWSLYLGFTVVMKPVFGNCTCELCILRAAVMHGKLMHDVFYSSRTSSLPSNHTLQKSTYECWHSFLKGPQDIVSLQYNGKIKERGTCNTHEITFLL
jgi:hypothetical protein